MQAIICLGAGVRPDGSLSSEGIKRVDLACELHKKNVGAYLVFSGGFTNGPVSEAQAMKERAVTKNICEDKILLEQKSRNTVENAYYCITEFVIPREWSDCLIVSSAYHLRRAEFIFSYLCPSVNWSVAGVDEKVPESIIDSEEKKLELIAEVFALFNPGELEVAEKIISKFRNNKK